MSATLDIKTNAPAGSQVAEMTERLRSGKVACWLVILLMPVGSSLDYFVYPEHLRYFAWLRLICSALTAGLLVLHCRDWQARNYRLFGVPVHRALGLPIALLPAFFISWMIYASEGINSPYYAGLNLIVLAVSVVVRWDVRDSVFAVLGVTLMYVVACSLHFTRHDQGGVLPDMLKNIYINSYFIFLTGIIVVAGNYYFNKLRTELGRVRDQLAQAEKLVSLGTMSAGVAHEFGNSLNIAKTGLYALRKQGRFLPEEKRVDYAELVDDTADGIKRAENIVTNLKIFTHPDFMRPDLGKLGELRAAEVVDEALRGISHLAQGPIQLVNQVEPELMVTANREQLLQVLTNLIRNALDALGEQAVKGRTPTVSVESRPLKGGQALVVRDNGPGIKPEHVARIFDPFFTTKDVGKGMGLGLTVCQGIMQAFGGNISVRSEPGKFCEFLLEFPPHS